MDEGHHLLLFSQFTSMLELLEADLRKEGINCFKLTGTTPKEERIRLVHAFNRHEVPVFLISLKAGGTGLNLIGADMVIPYNPFLQHGQEAFVQHPVHLFLGHLFENSPQA